MRLPEIRYNEVRMPRDDPGRAVAEYRTKQDVFEEGLGVIQGVARVKAETEEFDATTGLARDLGRLEREYAGRDVFTPDEVRELGLDDMVDVSEEGEDGPTDREFIPAVEVYPLLLQRKSREMIDHYGNSITDPNTRRVWVGEANNRRQTALTDVALRAAENMVSTQRDIKTLQMNRDVATGDYPAAEAGNQYMRAKGWITPEQYAINDQVIQEERVKGNVREAISSQDIALMAAEEQRLLEMGEGGHPFDDPQEYHDQLSLLRAGQKSAASAQKVQQDNVYNAYRDGFYQNLVRIPVGPQRMEYVMEAGRQLEKADLMTAVEYAGKDPKAIKTDPNAYVELTELIMQEPETFMTGHRLNGLVNSLSTSDFAKFQDIRRQMSEDPNALLSVNNAIKQTQQRMGVYVSGQDAKGDKADMMYTIDRLFRVAVNEWETNNPGKKLGDDDLNQISDRIINAVEEGRPGFWGGLFGAESAEYSITDIPDDEIDEARQAYINDPNNINRSEPNEQQLIRAWLAMKGKISG